MAYITLDELKAYMRVSSDGDDALMNASILAAQDRIDDICHRTFEAADDSVRYFDLVRDVRRRTIYFDTDLCQITSVENEGTTIAATQYFLEPRNVKPWYALTLRYNASKVWSYGTGGPEDAVKITGRWAYSITAPESVKYACKRLAAFYYREGDSQLFQTVGPEDQGQTQLPDREPKDVWYILKPFRRPASIRRRYY